MGFCGEIRKTRIMASKDRVKQYVAYWLQLGKKVAIENGDKTLFPENIIAGDRYSDEFEDCWEKILSPESGDCYIEGTDPTIAELLHSEWDIILCARCVMPIPMPTLGMPSNCCPCVDLPTWPNPELPQPRTPVNTTAHLGSIRYRILRQYTPESPQEPQESDPAIPLDFPHCSFKE